jgi:hypothetical protein
MQGARSTNAECPPYNRRAGTQYMRSEGSACILDGSFSMKAKNTHNSFLMQRYKKKWRKCKDFAIYFAVDIRN